jgi:hypothetical protein
MSTSAEFPTPIRLRGRLFFRRADLELYKRSLLAEHGLLKLDQQFIAPAIEELVTAEQAARELGCGRRTLGRRIARKKIGEVA